MLNCVSSVLAAAARALAEFRQTEVDYLYQAVRA